MNLRKSVAMAVGIVSMGLVVSCASTGTPAKQIAPKPKGFLDGYYQNLQPGPKDGAKMRWLKPGTDFGKYKKVMLDSVVFFFAPDSDDQRIDAQELKDLADSCNLALINGLKDAYPIVGEPGPDVVRIRFAITDLKQSRPVLSAVSTVVPIGLGVSLVKKGATGSWTGSGMTAAEFMALDSMTNQVIAVAQDERSADFEQRFSKWGSAANAFGYWAYRVRNYMDEAQSAKKQ